MRINGQPAPLHEVWLDLDHHRYYVPNRDRPVPSITGVIDSLGFGFPRGGGGATPERLEMARRRGSYVHGCAALRAVDDLDAVAVPEEYAPWVLGLLDAYTVLRLRPLLAEEPLYEPLYDFAGTLDYFGWAPTLVKPPGLALIELKTGDYSGVDMQLGAQAALLRANYPETRTIACFVLHLTETGRWEAERMTDEQGWQDFAAARRLYARLQRKRKEEAET